MFNDDNNGMIMPVAPTGFSGSNNGGMFGNDGNGWWIILLFILLGYGNNGWSNNSNASQPNGNTLYPWLNQSEQISNGFRDQSIQNGINDIQTQLCSGFANVNSNANTNAFATQNTINQGAFGLQSTISNGNFGLQNAMNQGFNNLQSQFSDCCCENRLASADLKYTIATENCADRYEAANNTRDIIENNNRNNQAILDKLCQIELDNVKAQVEAKNDQIAQLRSQLDAVGTNAAINNAVSRVIADNAAQTQILNPTPIPAFNVPAPYNCNCGCNTGCGC